jgi:hypothetical protein
MTLGLNQTTAPDSAVRMTLLGANPETVVGETPAKGVSNYLIGNDPTRWHRGVAHYARVRYANAWPGIDLVFKGRAQSLEYDFVLSPGSRPESIRLRFDNVRSLRLDARGELILETDQGQIRQHIPEIYGLDPWEIKQHRDVPPPR